MHYRRFPLFDDIEVSSLGLGCMRLPIKNGDPAAIDEESFDAMLRAATDVGINYLDTAYVYHGGAGEAALGAALERTGLRDRFMLATKAPIWNIESSGDWDRILDEQLERLKTTKIDFYLVHGLSAPNWDKALKFDVLAFLDRIRASGKVGHIGFSFHDNFQTFKKIIDGYPAWEFCQIQYNYVDRDFQAGEAGLAYAAERELGVIVMEPLRGGALGRPPRAVRETFAKYPTPRLPAEWALRFALDRQEVAVVLSGMGSPDQIRENAAVADAARPNALTRDERAILDEARDIFKAKQAVPCTGCAYCRPCPNGVLIPEIFGRYNAAVMFDAAPGSDTWYKSAFAAAGKGGDACIRCGACLSKCPQGIAIPDKLAEAHARLVG